MDAGNGATSGYRSGTAGGTLGIDYLFQNVLVGLSFTGGRGYSASSGDLPKTHADLGFWGIGLYSAVYLGDIILTADIGHNGSNATSKMNDFNVESDSFTSTWTAGLRGNYVFRTSIMDIVPHVGIRYTGSATNEYNVKVNGVDATTVEAMHQSNWTFPVGVKFVKGISSDGGWTFRPSLDLYVTPTAGNVYASGKSHPVGNPNQVTESRSQVLDVMTYSAALGFDVSNGAFSAGLSYNFDASPHRAAHNVGLSLRYDF